MSIIIESSSKSFKSIVKKSKCYADICRYFGLRKQGGFYRTIQRRIKREGIDITHFLSTKELLSKKANFQWISKENFLHRLNSEEHFCEATLKKKLIEFELIPHLCGECSLKSSWNNKPLVLQLDHRDGNHQNDKLENLRWLCPNCHSQTETFCGKHKKKKIKEKIKRGSNLKFDRYTKPSRKPPKEELIKVLGVISFREMGRKFGVSDNAVKKWCKIYGLPCRKKDLVGNSGVEPLNKVCKTSSLPLA